MTGITGSVLSRKRKNLCFEHKVWTSHTGVEQTQAYHHQEVMGLDTVIARTTLLDGGENSEPATEIYGKAQDGMGAGVRVDF